MRTEEHIALSIFLYTKPNQINNQIMKKKLEQR